jgi:hypothetical protein
MNPPLVKSVFVGEQFNRTISLFLDEGAEVSGEGFPGILHASKAREGAELFVAR